MPKLDTGKNSALFPLDHIVEIGVDKFKCCIRTEHVDDSLGAYLQAKFKTIENIPGTQKLSSQRKAFQRRLHVPVGGNLVLIESKPNKATYPWAATIEFNPNPYLRYGDKAIAYLGSFLRFLFGPDTHRVLPQAVVSMLHVNVDYDMNPLEGALVEAKGKRSGAKVLYDFDGQGALGSLYVGALGSDRRLCIYDKAAEVLHRELGPHANKILAALASDQWQIEVSKLKGKLDIPNRWRLEVRCEPKDAVPVANIADFASCFDGIRFLHLPPDVAPFNTALGRLFIACAPQRWHQRRVKRAGQKRASQVRSQANSDAGCGLVQRRLVTQCNRASHRQALAAFRPAATPTKGGSRDWASVSGDHPWFGQRCEIPSHES